METRRPGKHAVPRDAASDLMKMNGVSRKPGLCEPASRSHPRTVASASSTAGRSRVRPRKQVRERNSRDHSPVRNSRSAKRSRRRRWRLRSIRQLRPRPRRVAHARVSPWPKQPEWRRQRVPSKSSSWRHLSQRVKTAGKPSVAVKVPHFVRIINERTGPISRQRGSILRQRARGRGACGARSVPYLNLRENSNSDKRNGGSWDCCRRNLADFLRPVTVGEPPPKPWARARQIGIWWQQLLFER